MTRQDALSNISSHLGEIRRFGVERIGLFGSVARTEAMRGSDIDILVRFTKGKKTFDNYMGLRFYLESLFPAHSVDVVIEETLKPRIKASVYQDIVYAS